jgi:hypothetical protein
MKEYIFEEKNTWNIEYQYYSESKDLFYTAITKNASTECIKVLVEDKNIRINASLSDVDEVHNLGYLANVKSWRKAYSSKYKMVVFRDPIDRIVSAFNDIIVNRHQLGVASSICHVRGYDLKDFNFNFFIDYIVNTPCWHLDPHFKRQCDFLINVDYNLVININNLKSTWETLFGDTLAPTTKKHYSKQKVDISDAYNIPFDQLVDLSRRGFNLSSDSYLNENIKLKIQLYYADDFEILTKYCK